MSEDNKTEVKSNRGPHGTRRSGPGRREATDRSVSGILGNFMGPAVPAQTRQEPEQPAAAAPSTETVDKEGRPEEHRPEEHGRAMTSETEERQQESSHPRPEPPAEDPQPESLPESLPRSPIPEPASSVRQSTAWESTYPESGTPAAESAYETPDEDLYVDQSQRVGEGVQTLGPVQTPETEPARHPFDPDKRFDTNPAVTAMHDLVARGQIRKRQKGYELPETHEWALQDLRQYMMRVERFSAREASASNCVAAALELYYLTLFGKRIDAEGPEA